MQPDDKERGRLAALQADFEAVKAEIARRSTLQRVAILSYLAVLAWAVNEVFADEHPFWLILPVWAASWLALGFHQREHLEIRRLGTIVTQDIAPAAATLLGVTPEQVFPSEFKVSMPEITRRTLKLHVQFMIAIFLAAPTLLSVWLVYANRTHLQTIFDSEVIVAVLALLLAFLTARLLIGR